MAGQQHWAPGISRYSLLRWGEAAWRQLYVKVCSAAQSCLTLGDPIDCSPPALSTEFSRQEYGEGCHFLLQGIFWTQGSNPHHLHRQVDSLPLNHLEIPSHKAWV